MKTIEQRYIKELKIQKSRFITLLFPLYSIDDVSTYIEQVKKEYPGATHYCIAYIFDQIERFSDDGEPNGTAGMPMLNVLKNQELNHILAIVVRYFGGIKLGAGGLVRAYTNSVSEALNEAEIISLEKGLLISLEFPYEQTKDVDYLCRDFRIIHKEYHDKIIYQVEIPKVLYPSFQSHVNHLPITIQKKVEINIKKM